MSPTSTAAPQASSMIRERVTLPRSRRGGSDAAARIVRQIEAIDLWVAWRRERERDLHTQPMSRSDRLDVSRHIDALRRTHDTIKGRCAADLNDELEPFREAATAVIAHRHPWFVEKLSAALYDCGVTVLAATDNGAEALGVAIADQPDLLLAGESLTMMHGTALLAETRRFAPLTISAMHGLDPAQAGQALADALYPRHYSPAVVADALVALHLNPLRQLPLPARGTRRG